MADKRKITFSIIFAAALLAGVALLAELTGFVCIAFHAGGTPSREELKKTLDRPVKTDTDATFRRSETDLPAWMQPHILHPYIGFVRNPRLSRQVFNNRTVHLAVNEYGYFGDPPPKFSSENSITIALTGGSVALELFLFSMDILKQGLARVPGMQNKEIRIISLALGGKKQPQQLMALNYFLAMGHHFDLLINCDGFNEVALPFAQNVPYNIHPFHPRMWGVYAKKSVQADAAVLYGEIFQSKQRLENWRTRISRPFYRYSSFWLFVWHRIKTQEENRQTGFDSKIREMLTISVPTHPQETGPSYTVFSDEDVFEDCADMWKQSSFLMWNLCKANQIGYLHLLQPNQYVKGSKVLNEWELENTYSGPENLSRIAVEQGYPLLVENGNRLAKGGLPFYDLTQIFSGHSETLYRDNSCHYNERGYAILAEKIVQLIDDYGVR